MEPELQALDVMAHGALAEPERLADLSIRPVCDEEADDALLASREAGPLRRGILTRGPIGRSVSSRRRRCSAPPGRSPCRSPPRELEGDARGSSEEMQSLLLPRGASPRGGPHHPERPEWTVSAPQGDNQKGAHPILRPELAAHSRPQLGRIRAPKAPARFDDRAVEAPFDWQAGRMDGAGRAVHADHLQRVSRRRQRGQHRHLCSAEVGRRLNKWPNAKGKRHVTLLHSGARESLLKI